jgi:hypothetical protein
MKQRAQSEVSERQPAISELDAQVAFVLIGSEMTRTGLQSRGHTSTTCRGQAHLIDAGLTGDRFDPQPSRGDLGDCADLRRR